MKKDQEIQKNVMEELKHIPSINATSIGVAVKNGIVTLTGIVDSYPKKIALERAALKVKDVIGIAEEVEVDLDHQAQKTDSELAQAVLYSLEWHSGLDPKKIRIVVENGTVSIDGEVEWDYQRKLAYKTVANIKGVRAITNNLKLSHKPLPSQVERNIASAFLRNANIDAKKIQVKVDGTKVELTGKVRCFTEKKEAENSVWRMPGITEVVNKLQYEESYDPSEVL